MSRIEPLISQADRARLALKGRLLYGKFCGTDGRGICAESFALFHIWQGAAEIAEDLLAFLESQIEALRRDDPSRRLALTEDLAARIAEHLSSDAESPPDPSLWASILKNKKQHGKG